MRSARIWGSRCCRWPAYYAYYEEPNPGQRDRYVASLRLALPLAARAGVLLAIENVDGNDVTSIPRAMEIVDEIDSPRLQLYPDIGNITEQQLDETEEFARGQGRMLALHVKDVRPGQPRRCRWAKASRTSRRPSASWSGRAGPAGS